MLFDKLRALRNESSPKGRLWLFAAAMLPPKVHGESQRIGSAKRLTLDKGLGST